MKIRSIYFVFVFLFVSNAHAATEANCKVADPAHIQASYKITRGNEKYSKSENITITRKDGLVAHTNHDAHISDVWFKHSNNRVALVRYFDEHKRGIEYEPFDLRKNGKEIDWGNKYQLISEQTLKALTLVAEGKIGCDKIEFYEGEINGHNIRLEWLPEHKLVKLLSVSKENVYQNISLTDKNVDTENAITFYSDREKFQLTDYTDIGDNESDPFLLSMINLGFVEHGGEGFYDAEGNQMGAQHGHHH